MCGRYNFSKTDLSGLADILAAINVRFDAAAAPKTGEIRPTDEAPILAANSQGSLRVVAAKWGWPKQGDKGVIINTRAETAAQKSLFSASLAARRCVVLSSGFYEWQHNNAAHKTKYLLRQGAAGELFMAGIYNFFKDKNGDAYIGFTVLTTQASDSVAQIHNRMPVLLAANELERWVKDPGFTNTVLMRNGGELSLFEQQS